MLPAIGLTLAAFTLSPFKKFVSIFESFAEVW